MQHCKFLICLSTFVTNYSVVIDFVEYRQSVKPLDGLIFFQTNKFTSDGIERELQHSLLLPQVVLKNVIPSDVHHCMNNKNIALIFMEKLDDSRTWEIVSQSLHRRYYVPMVFVIQSVPQTDVMLKFFNYFRKVNMINTVLLFRENDIMMVRTSIAYPKVQIIDVDPRNFSGFAWQKYRNVLGYNFHFSVFNDPPVAYQHVTNNRTEIGGITGELLTILMQRVNGTFTVISYPMNDTTLRRIDMTANLLFKFDRSMEPSYPVYQTTACLLLPIEPDIPLSWYLWYTFDISTWQALGFTFLVIALLKIVINRNHNSDLVLNGLSVLQLFLAQSILLPGNRSVTRALFIVYFGELFVIIASVYAGCLTSLFSTRVRMPAVRTPEDFLKTDLKIMVTDSERELFFDGQLLPTLLEPRTYNIGNGTAAIDHTTANTSFAYIMTRNKWLWFKKPCLEHPVFRIATGTLCTPSLLYAFALQRQSPFREMIKILYMELEQLGLIDYWLRQVPPAAKVQLNDERDMSEMPLSLAHFTLVFPILGVGWILALVTFVGELIIARRRENSASRVIMRHRNPLIGV